MEYASGSFFAQVYLIVTRTCPGSIQGRLYLPGREMRMVVLLLLCLLLLPALSQAQCPGVTSQQTPFATEKLTLSTTAMPLTASVYKPSGITPTMAVLSVEGGDMRYEVVGTPTANTGHFVGGTTTFAICGLDSIAAFQSISVTTTATLVVTYYKNRSP
jgi:hypothetical protein